MNPESVLRSEIALPRETNVYSFTRITMNHGYPHLSSEIILKIFTSFSNHNFLSLNIDTGTCVYRFCTCSHFLEREKQC
ncbi:hypothetical protein L6452_20619 [Arctium lappa]|uniref:Uncharacterized protein n=1 Tax=Arctium lappa TaxID=4217 RepID=A0ACB9BBD7_ARCLA|nr:hypothetical protein L6452_20619 [Arctium lappa]